MLSLVGDKFRDAAGGCGERQCERWANCWILDAHCTPDSWTTVAGAQIKFDGTYLGTRRSWLGRRPHRRGGASTCVCPSVRLTIKYLLAFAIINNVAEIWVANYRTRNRQKLATYS